MNVFRSVGFEKLENLLWTTPNEFKSEGAIKSGPKPHGFHPLLISLVRKARHSNRSL